MLHSIDREKPADLIVRRRGFALLFCHIGNAAGLLYCLTASALFCLRFLRLFCLVFDRRLCRLCSRGICVRCFLRLQTQVPVRSPVSSPTWPPSPCPASSSGRGGLISLARISQCSSLGLCIRILYARTSGAKLSPSAVHAPALRSHISALGTFAGSALKCGASAASACHRSALCHHVPASKTPGARSRTSTLVALAESTGAFTLTALDILVRTLTKRTIWSSWTLETLTVSTGTSTLPVPAVTTWTSSLPTLEVLIRTLAERAIRPSWSLETSAESSGAFTLLVLAESTWPSALPALDILI